ncbi:uncharacterized protein [Diadema setosum]|uniref:uncharacterized protein n=1 Tax=Diadema setosum TaxID=31175 RepID=UPI003B3AC995
MDRRYDLVLLLVFTASACCGLTTEVVDTVPTVQGWRGKVIRLPCHFQGEPKAVVWVKESNSNQQARTTKAGFLDETFLSWEERFDIDKDFRLAITDLEVADEGLYLCQVVLRNLQDFENSILLTVASIASKHGIEECVEKSQSHRSRCTYQTPSVSLSFTLTCVVSGFKPNISMLWTDESGKRLNSTVSRQTTLPDNTYKRIETITVSAQRGIEQTFACMATGDSLNGTSTEKITLLPVSVIDTAPTVHGWKGENIRLPCHFQGDPEAVIWVKESISQQHPRTTKADYIGGTFQSREERFSIEKNFSLFITDLEVADDGQYLCQVVLRNFENFENSILLTVGSMASKHGIEECIEKSLSNQERCTYQTPFSIPDFNLTCVVSGFRPNISMLWTDESGKRLNSTVSQQTALPDDTYERFETITVSAKHETERSFTCTATGDSLNGTSTEEITILPVSEKRDNLSLIIGIIIGVPVAVSILFLLVGKCLQKYHPDSLPRKDVAGIPAGGDHVNQSELMRRNHSC